MIKNVVFIDSRVADYQVLVAALPENSKWFLLNAEEDGVEQMAAALAEYGGLDSIQVISHGSAGALYLGGTVLSSSNLSLYENPLQAIGASLSQTGDILLYGCNVASGEVGSHFIQEIARHTGADVAASTNLTGQEGDWVLEASTAEIQTQGLVLPEASITLANQAPVVTHVWGLDTVFSGDGKVTTQIATGWDTAHAIALQADGKIVVAGSAGGVTADLAVVRYKADGSLDTSFSGDGKFTMDVGSQSNWASSIAVQTNGKILVAGTSWIGGDNDFTLHRLNSDGSLDFIRTTHFGFGDDYAESVAVQADGKILVAGHAWNGANDDFALARYNTDGSDDTSFDGDGRVTTAIGSFSDSGSQLALQADGKILVAGSSWNSVNGVSNFALVRYNGNGSLDTSFDGDGKVTTALGTGGASGYAMALQADGKVLVAGECVNGTNFDFALVRYNSDGSLDTSFDGDGRVTTSIGVSATAFSLVLQADGKILAAGRSWNGADYDFALVRYNGDGSLDTSFDGEDGRITFGIGSSDIAYDLALQGNGKILMAGETAAFGGDYDFAVARLAQNISLLTDTSVDEGVAFSYSVPGSAFSDPNGDTLTYSAKLSTGAALPDWLKFNASTLTFKGTPDSGDVGTWNIRVTAKDPGGLAVSDTFQVTVNNVVPLTYIGTLGNDVKTGTSVDDYMAGRAGNDKLTGLNGADDLYGGSGDDTLIGNQGNDDLHGGEDDDDLTGGAGADFLQGGLGEDRASYSTASSGVTADLINGGSKGDASGDTYDSIETLVGSSFGDTLLGSNNPDTFLLVGGMAKYGNDVIDGRGGLDRYSTENFSLAMDINLGAGAGALAAQAGITLPSGAGVVKRATATGFEYDVLKNIEWVESGGGDDRIIGSIHNDTLAGGAGSDYLDGAGGIDLVSYLDSSYRVTVELDAGLASEWGPGSTIYSTDTVKNFEGAIGSALDDGLLGNDGANMLAGMSGKDVLVGRGGVDVLFGGFGDDLLVGGEGNDFLVGNEGKDILNGGDGVDWLSFHLAEAGVWANLDTGRGRIHIVDDVELASESDGDDYLNIENIAGSHFADTLIGDRSNNTIIGFEGNDVIWGYGGNDILYGDQGPAPSRDMPFTGSELSPDEPDVNPNSTKNNDRIEGGTGNDQIFGGVGLDHLHGNEGDDFVSGQGSTDMLYGDAGTDTLLGGAGLDMLFGGGGNDTLEGGGGFDTLDGGEGLDVASYAASAAAVQVTLRSGNANAGGDAVGNVDEALISLLMDSFNDYFSSADSVAITGWFNGLVQGSTDPVVMSDSYVSIEGLIGSRFNDSLEGNDIRNILDGRAGVDTMKGWGGDDDYYVDSLSDGVVENANQGIDTVYSTVGWTLGGNLENLTLMGAKHVNGVGNGANNILVGNSGNNSLNGDAGKDMLISQEGNDMLTGGQGGDKFVFNSALNINANVDVITDFSAGEDKICLDDDIFKAIGSVTSNTVLGTAKFYKAAGATSAHDADDRIIYNTSSGALYYDADGNGTSFSATQFATVGSSSHPNIAVTDFLVIA